MEWISVNEKEPQIPCLVWNEQPDGGFGGVELTKEVTRITAKGNTYYLSDSTSLFIASLRQEVLQGIENCTHITHWMPLPQPPKEDA